MGCSTLYLFYNIRDTLLWIYTHKHMDMIYVTFHSKYIYIVRLTFHGSQFFKSVFDTRNIENLPTISWTEHKMIVYQ